MSFSKGTRMNKYHTEITIMIVQGLVFEMLSGINECDHCIFFNAALSSREEGLKNSGLNWYSNPELCNAGAVLYQLSYQATWEQVITWVA